MRSRRFREDNKVWFEFLKLRGVKIDQCLGIVIFAQNKQAWLKVSYGHGDLSLLDNLKLTKPQRI